MFLIQYFVFLTLKLLETSGIKFIKLSIRLKTNALKKLCLKKRVIGPGTKIHVFEIFFKFN